MGNPIEDPLEITLPTDLRLENRTISVFPGKQTTFRMMHDPFDADRDRWFKQGGGMPRVTDGNEVKNLIRGNETYADMAANMRIAALPDPERQGPAYIYLAGWDLNGGSYFSMPMQQGNAGSSLDALFKAASAAGAEIRVMAWANGIEFPFENASLKNVPSTIFAVDAINRLPTGRGVVDWKTAVLFRPPRPVSDHPVHIGAHHQKMVIIHGSGQIVAYVGGIDVDVKRLDDATGSINGDKIGWEDVHCRIRGPAADDVLATFSDRWNDYLNAPNADPDANHDTHQPAFKDNLDRSIRNRLTAPRVPRSRAVDAAVHRQSVQICRTFHSKIYDLIPPGNRAGEKTIRESLKHAIGQAKQFIYMEDQYIFSMDISNALKKAIAAPSFRWLIILIPRDDQGINSELRGQGSHRRAEFINNLRNAPGGEKVKVFTHTQRFVHSKIYIIDDIFAVIGSANCNRRGMEHDTEITANIFDRASDKAVVLHFARRLRMRLWATHLNLKAQATEPSSPANGQDEYLEMADGVGSAVHWLKRSPSARVAEYVVNDDLNLAFQALKDEKDKLKDKIKKVVPKPSGNAVELDVQKLLLDEVDRRFARFSADKQGIDNAWNDLLDPGDP
jgi:phosphatidylserine/phosphatidylglycerophosphate/cardiolipin synthase-like enzyme